jgi:hypothetical protein
MKTDEISTDNKWFRVVGYGAMLGYYTPFPQNEGDTTAPETPIGVRNEGLDTIKKYFDLGRLDKTTSTAFVKEYHALNMSKAVDIYATECLDHCSLQCGTVKAGVSIVREAQKSRLVGLLSNEDFELLDRSGKPQGVRCYRSGEYWIDVREYVVDTRSDPSAEFKPLKIYHGGNLYSFVTAEVFCLCEGAASESHSDDVVAPIANPRARILNRP